MEKSKEDKGEPLNRNRTPIPAWYRAPNQYGSDDHRIRLVKDGPHIQMLENDRVIIDTIDNATEQMGGVIHGTGQIGFRQMHWTKARYRNFKVWELE